MRDFALVAAFDEFPRFSAAVASRPVFSYDLMPLPAWNPAGDRTRDDAIERRRTIRK